MASIVSASVETAATTLTLVFDATVTATDAAGLTLWCDWLGSPIPLGGLHLNSGSGTPAVEFGASSIQSGQRRAHFTLDYDGTGSLTDVTTGVPVAAFTGLPAAVVG